MVLTVNDLLDEGYSTTDEPHLAMYMLADGSLWDANVEYGSRGSDHREVEAFTENDRYSKYGALWTEVFVELGLIMLVPESYTIYVHPDQEVTAEQWSKIQDFTGYGWELEPFE